MDSNQNRELNDSKTMETNEDKKKRNRCLVICLVILIVMMLPSTLAFLAIF